MEAARTLTLDRQLQNAAFESWRLGANFVAGRTALALPGPLFQGADEAVDFAHTRAAVLHNHLLESDGRLLLITAAGGPGGPLHVHEVLGTPGSGQPPRLVSIAVVPAPAPDVQLGAATEASLHCTAVVVAEPRGTTAAPPGQLLLASSGRGDLVLLQPQPGSGGDAGAVCSPPLFPLRPRPPAVGVRPFSLLAAWRSSSTGSLCCVVTTLSSVAGADRRGGSSSQWVAETWLLRLAPPPPPPSEQLAAALQLLGCQLLLVSRGPPAAACGASSPGGADHLLLVAEPALEADELPPGYYSAHPAAALGSTPQPAGAPAAPQQQVGGAAAAAQALGDDDGDIDPRTLAAAAARLAQYSSDERVGDLPQQQWSDVFKESGPDELGHGGSEPAASILLFNSSSSGGGSGCELVLACSVACGPHRLLAAQPLQAAAGPGVLLGVTDDVDCAVVSAALSSQGAQPASAAAAAAGDSSSECVVAVSHTATLPALAYVVAGKTQRRHLLLGGRWSPVAAVLVEGAKYAYLYGQVAGGSSSGQQQIVDMELPEGGSILGARLVQAAPIGQPASAPLWLLLLSQQQLLCYELQRP